MNKLRFLISFGIATLMIGCATTERWYEPIDKRIIGDEDYQTTQIIADYSAKISELPIDQQLYQIPRLGELPPGTSGNFGITVVPNYTADLSALTDQAKSELDLLIERLKNHDNVTIVVTGHASSEPLSDTAVARFGDNTGLSKHRAKVVADYLSEALSEHNVQISSSGRGDTETRGDPRAKANRRVEINGSFAAPGAPFADNAAAMPASYSPWWRKVVTLAFDRKSTGIPTSLDDLYYKTLTYSTQVKVFSDIPLIRETAILEAEGRFDPHAFAEARYNDVDEPVGSTLTTGGPERFSEQEAIGQFGVRKKTTTGGEIEISQRLSTKDNNSTFFIPDDQATSRMLMRYTQPLLNGAWLDYNRSTVAIAKLDSQIAYDEFQRQLESHLLEVTRAYWTLYRERAILAQRRKLAEDTEAIVARIKARKDIDALESDMTRAHAALVDRRADSIRAEAAVKNAQSRLIALTNAPEFKELERFEFIPTVPPLISTQAINLRRSGELALQNRPEIAQVIKQVKAASIRAEMSKNELLPILDFVIEGRLDGLDDGFDIGDSYARQFEEGRPSVGVGFRFDMPLGNREAKARHQRRNIEVRQLQNQLRTTIDTVMLEVKVAGREVDTTYREAQSNYAVLDASERELSSIRQRYESATDNRTAATVFLDNLLDAQARLAEAEQSFVSSLVVFNVALRNLDRATGVLLQTEGVNYRRVDDSGDGFPGLIVERNG